MKLSPKVLWLAICVGMAVGIVPRPDDAASEIRSLQSSHMCASSHTLAQRQPTVNPSHILASSHIIAERQPTVGPAPSHMFASSHALAQRQATASPVLGTSISLVTVVANGLTAVAPTNIVITLTPGKYLTSTSNSVDTDIVQVAAITTVTSFLGPPPSTTKASTKPIGSTVVTLTSTVEDVVTVTSILPSVTTFPDPQSQVQGSTSSGPPISFVPVASTTAKSAPTSTTKPHTVPSAGGYKYLGCYAEGLVVRALGDAFFPNDENTIERCAAACYPYKYAGAEYGRECWCGNELKGASKVSDSEFCNMPCAGDQQQYCGGIVALNVYVAEGADSSSLIPVTVSGTASLSGKTSSASIPSSSTRVSSTQSSTSQAIASSMPSSSASTRLASTSSTVISSKASSDSQVLTASSASSKATSSSSSSTITSIVQSTFVTSTQAVPVSVIVENGTTTTTSLTTRTETPTIPAIIASSSSTTAQIPTSFILPSPPKQTAPSPLVPTTKVSVTVSITVQPASTSRKIVTIPVIVTNIHTVTKKPVPTALPMVNSSTSSPPVTSPTSTSTSNTPSPPSTSSSTSISTNYPILGNPDATTVIPTPAPPISQPITIPEPWSGMWTTGPPGLAMPGHASPFAETTASSPAGIAPGLDASATTVSPTRAPPQSGYTPLYYTPVPLTAISKPLTTSKNGISTSTTSYPRTITYTYGTSSQQPWRSVVTVTSFLTPTTRLPTAAASPVQETDIKIVTFLAGLWVLIFVV